MTESARGRVRYEPHPNLGYVVYVDGEHLGSVQKRMGTWWARSDYHTSPSGWPTRRDAVAALQSVIGRHQ